MAEYTFGPFTVDTGSVRVWREGVEVRLRPRAFQTLRVLLAHRGQFVGYEQMMAEAWEGTHVSRHTVDVTVAEVRKSLGEYGRWVTHRPKIGFALEVPSAEEHVRLGWHYLNQRTRYACERAVESFRQAIAECPDDFRAYDGLSAAFLTLGVFAMRPPRETYPRFLEAHERAAALGGLRPDIRSNRAYGLFLFERDVAGAEAEFLRAIEEKPALGSSYVRLGMLYGSLGRFAEAREVLGRGHAAEPLLATLPAAEILVHVWERAYDRGIQIGERAVALHPYLQVVRANYGMALEFGGRPAEALEQYQIACVLSPDLPWLRALEGACLARLGRVAEAQAVLDLLQQFRRSEYVDATYLAMLHSVLGHADDAMAELERAVEENSVWLYTLDVDPKLDLLRADPRFERIRGAVEPSAL